MKKIILILMSSILFATLPFKWDNNIKYGYSFYKSLYFGTSFNLYFDEIIRDIIFDLKTFYYFDEYLVHTTYLGVRFNFNTFLSVGLYPYLSLSIFLNGGFKFYSLLKTEVWTLHIEDENSFVLSSKINYLNCFKISKRIDMQTFDLIINLENDLIAPVNRNEVCVNEFSLMPEFHFSSFYSGVKISIGTAEFLYGKVEIYFKTEYK